MPKETRLSQLIGFDREEVYEERGTLNRETLPLTSDPFRELTDQRPFKKVHGAMKVMCCYFLLLLISTAVRLEAQTRGSWQTLAPMPSMRQEVSTAVLGGKVYVIGGFFSNGASSNLVEVYDPEANTWTAAATLPIENNHNAAATVDNRIFAFGGASNRCFTYRADLNQWSEVASMNFRHGNTPAVAVISGKIYVAGGDGPGMTQRETEVYDPTTNQWTVVAPMNLGRNHTAGVAINGRFYVVGGRPSAAAARALEVYDPATNVWTELPGIPTGRSGIAAASVNGELYVFGGEIPQIFNNVEVFNPLSNSWEQLPPMPVAKHGIYAAVINNKIYMPGGATVQGLGATNINQAYSVNTAATVSAASFSAVGIAERAILAAFGSGLALSTATAATQPLPDELDGTRVDVLDRTGIVRRAPLFFVSPGQVNYQLPPGTSAGPVTVRVHASDNQVSTAAFEIRQTSPAIFTVAMSGTGAAAALDGLTFTGAPFAATQMNGGPNIIAFFGSGLGAEATDQDGNLAASVIATVDGALATVFYAGHAPGYTGLNQFNIGLPVGIGSGFHQIIVTRSGQTSNVVTIEIR